MTEQVVREFADAGFELFLHGSRSKVKRESPDAFEYILGMTRWSHLITPETDWDYAVQSSQAVINFLHRNHFEMKEESNYRDSMTEFVFEKILEDGTKIQVSTRYNLEEFKDLWNAIEPWWYEQFLWKRGPNAPTGEQISQLLDFLRSFRWESIKKYQIPENLKWE